jgi:hypothetical protein
MSAVKGVEPVSDRMSYIIWRGHNIGVNIHAITRDTIEDEILSICKLGFYHHSVTTTR